MSQLANYIGAYTLGELEEKLREAIEKRDQTEAETELEYKQFVEAQKQLEKELSAQLSQRNHEARSLVGMLHSALNLAKRHGLGEKTTKRIESMEAAGYVLSTVSLDGREIWVLP